MTLLQVSDRDNVLVVDSRLIAEQLGVKHKTVLETLEKHQTHIEQAFGVVPFETEKPLKGTNGGRPERFAYLNENQATLLMTFSRNTDKVIACKVALVSAFSKAKEMLAVSQSREAKLTKPKTSAEMLVVYANANPRGETQPQKKMVAQKSIRFKRC